MFRRFSALGILRERISVKVQDSMLAAPPPGADSGARSFRLDADTTYVLRMRLDGLDLEPG